MSKRLLWRMFIQELAGQVPHGAPFLWVQDEGKPSSMLIFVFLVQSILLILLHAKSEKENIGFVQHPVEGARQITIFGQISNFEGSKPVLISLKCTGPEDVFPLVLALYDEKLELSAEPGDEQPTRFDRRFQIGRIVITISIFSDKFYVTIEDSFGFATYDLAPVDWFVTDFAVGKNCEHREIFYADGAFVHDEIRADPTPRYVHKIPFSPGNSIIIHGEVIAENGNFDVSITYPEGEGGLAPLIVSVTKGKIHLQCLNDSHEVDAHVSKGVLMIAIDLRDTHSVVELDFDDVILPRLQCLHGELISKLNTITFGPISSFIPLTPRVQQMFDRIPVYVARYSNDSAYQMYKKATEKDTKLVKKVLSGGESSYGLDVDDAGKWQLVRSQSGSIGFHFARLPFHFAKCPCDCLSDVNNAILLDKFQNSNYTAENQLKTVVFYQWKKNQGVKFQVTKQFVLEIFSHTIEHGECVWGKPLGIITSIEEEFEAVMSTGGNLLTRLVHPNKVDRFGIKIWRENATFHIRAFGVPLEFTEDIIFVQIVGLKSILHYYQK